MGPELARKFAPKGVKALLWKAFITARTKSAAPVERLRPGPLAVAGFFGTSSGLGQSARLCHQALTLLGHDPVTHDVSGWFGNADMACEASRSIEGEGGTLIVHVNGPELPKALAILGRRAVLHTKVIAYWAWELPSPPSGWTRALPFVHEVWAPSAFTADSLKSLGCPVRTVPHPVLPASIPCADRAAFGIDADKFVVLSLFDMRSSFVRKNPMAVIRSFLKAFNGVSDARLLIKVGNPDFAPHHMTEMEALAKGDPRVSFLTRVLDEGERDRLIASADVLVSLHRSEGFGLTLAEAMRMGVPVIATGWSGNTEFMTPDCAALVAHRQVTVQDPGGPYATLESSWAEPDEEVAAEWLWRLYAQPDLCRQLGEAGARHVEKHLGLVAYGSRVKEALFTGI